MSPQPLQVPGLKVIKIIITLYIHRSTCHLDSNVKKLFLVCPCRVSSFLLWVNICNKEWSLPKCNRVVLIKVLQETSTLAYLS
jgi:hypothetical protein